MFDFASFSSALASLKVIIELAKGVNNAQLAAKVTAEVSEIQMKLLTVQQQALELQDENLRLTQQNQTLEQQLAEKKSEVFLHGVWWLTYDVLNPEESEIKGAQVYDRHYDGPYCPLCKEVGHQWVHLKGTGQTAQHGNLVFECEIHHTDYEAPAMS